MNVRMLPWLVALVGLSVPLIGSGFALWPSFVGGLTMLGLVWAVGGAQPQPRRGRIGFALVLLPFLFLTGSTGGWWLIPADLVWLAIEITDRGRPDRQPVAPKTAT